MYLADLKEILVPADRMRKEFEPGAHKDLMLSIQSKGLIHPVTLEKDAEGKLKLVAGERRLRAMTALHSEGIAFRCNGADVGQGQIPYLLITELTEWQILEVELEENVIRQDLTWLEQAAARKKLFDLRREQAAQRGEIYTATNLAEELKRAGASDTSIGKVTRDLHIGRYINDPKVRGAKTFNEAVAVAKKATENLMIEALGDAIQIEAKPIKHRLIEGDSKIELSKLEANQYDCIITDPPYGIGIDDAGSMVTHDHHYDDGPEVLDSILESVPNNLYRIARAQAHLYWFCDLRKFALIGSYLEDAGFLVSKFPIIWWKRGKAMAPDITRWPKREYECIIYAIKGDKPPFKVAGDVISTPYGADLQQAEKPKELYLELLSRSVLAGSQIIDPFCGTGVVFAAAEELKCAATGIEKDPMRADLARIRATGEL